MNKKIKKFEPIVFGVGRHSGTSSTMQIMSPERDSSKNVILEGMLHTPWRGDFIEV